MQVALSLYKPEVQVGLGGDGEVGVCSLSGSVTTLTVPLRRSTPAATRTSTRNEIMHVGRWYAAPSLSRSLALLLSCSLALSLSLSLSLSIQTHTNCYICRGSTFAYELVIV